MNKKKPTMQEWKALYDAAMKVKQNECWSLFDDEKIFGVKDPETGMIGYCLLMGRMEEHYGVAVYKGSRGLEALSNIIDGNILPTLMGALQSQNCLMASFEDRKYLDKNDYKIIKGLGLKFRGRNSWPLFRDYTPGYLPFNLNSSDVRFLTQALEQTLHIYHRIADDPDLLMSKGGSCYLVRVPIIGSDGIEWKDEWVEPEPPADDARGIDFRRVPELKELLEEIRKKRESANGVWEVGTFFSPEGVMEGTERPYFPKMFVYGDNRTGLLLSFLMAEPKHYQAIFLHHFLSFLVEVEKLPGMIMALDEEIISLLLPFLDELDIEIIKVDNLPVIEEFESELA